MAQVQSALVEKLSKVVIDCNDAILSRTWTYPLLGMYYFATHRNLYKPIVPALVQALVVSSGIIFCLIFFTFLPQMAFCALFSGMFAPIVAAVMVLGEAYMLIWVIGKSMMLTKVQDRLFDQVMVMKGHEELVAKGGGIRSQGRSTRFLGNIKPGLVDGLGGGGALRYVMSLPLNLIPGIGTAMFLVYNGEKQGPGYHGRYFELKGWDGEERKRFVDERKGGYTGFGAMGVVLEMVPCVGPGLRLTTTVGAALWASRLEGGAGRDK